MTLQEIDEAREAAEANAQAIEFDGCVCICHIKTTHVRHFMPCCEFTYVKFIETDGIISLEDRHHKDDPAC